MANSDELDFSDLQAQAEQLLEIYKEQTAELQKQAQVKHTTLSNSSMPDTVEGIKKENNAKKEAIIIDGQLTQKYKEQLAAKQLLTQLSSVERRDLKDNAILQNAAKDSIAAMTIEVRKLTEEWRNGSEAVRDKLSPQIDALNAKLKQSDTTIGIHTRNVGNYANSVRDAAMKVGGLTGIMAIFGRMVGINTEDLQELREVHSTLREGSRDLSHLTHQHSEALHENAEASKIATEANEEEAASQMAALGIMAAVVIAIGAIVAIYAVWSSVQEKNKQELEERSKAIDGSIITDDKLREAYNKEAIAIQELADKYQVLTGAMSETEASKRKLMMQFNDDATKLNNDYAKKLQDAPGFGDDKYERDKKRAAVTAQYNKDYALLKQKLNEELDNQDQEAINKYIEKYQAGEKRISELKDATIQDEHKRKLAELDTKKSNDTFEILESEYTEEQKGQLIKQVNEQWHLEVEAEDERYLKEKKKKLEEEWKAFKEFADKISEADAKLTDKMTEAVNKKQKFIEEQQKRHTDNSYDTLIGADKLAIDRDKNNPKALLADKNTLVDNETGKKKADIAYDQQKQIEAAKAAGIKDGDAIIIQINQDAQDKMDLADKEAAAKQLQNQKEYTDALKKETEKRLEAELKAQQEGLRALEQILNAENQLKEQSLKEQTDLIQNQAQVQSELAAAGRKNTLAQTMAAENKAAEDALKQQRAVARQKEDIELANLFITAEGAFIKGGDSPTKAAAEAMGAVLLAKGLAAGLAGSFFEGTPDTGGPGRLDNKGGMLAVLHPHEAVIPKARNEEFPGLAKAWITGNLDTYLAKVAMPEIHGTDMKRVEQELGEIKNAIINQPQRVVYEQGGETIIDEKSGDNRKRIIVEQPIRLSIHG